MKRNKQNSTPDNGTNQDDLYLEKNRIRDISAESGEHSLEPSSKFDKKPIIILSSIAAVLLIGILVVTQFIYRKPDLFKSLTGPQTNPQNSPFEDLKREPSTQSENLHIIRGKESYLKGYLNDAVSEFNSVVESDATDKDKAIALTYLGMISDDKGEYDKAVDFYTRAQTYDKNNADIYKNLSIAYRHKKEYDKAAESAEKSASLNSDDTDAKILLGNIYFETNKYEEAIEQYRAVLDKQPENAKVLYNMGSALMKKGDEFSAMEYFKKAGAADRIGEIAHKAYSRLGVIYTERKNFEEAEKYLKEAVSIRPNDALNRYNLGIAYLRQNKNTEAMEELSRAESLGESNSSVLESIGEAYFNLKNYDKSLDIYNKIKKENDRNVKILSRIAEIYYEKGDLDKAYEMYKKITMIEPATENARVAYLNMGNILDDAQRFDEAIDAYQKALAVSPKDESTYFNLGIAYKHAGKPELAITAWKKAAELNPNDANPLIAIADYYYERGYYDLAESEYQRIIGRWPNIQEPHFKMATMYYKRGNFDYALSAYNKVVQLDPNSDLARKSLINRAILTSKTAKGAEGLEKSMNLIQKALLMKPNDSEALLALGLIYMKKEMYDNAVDTFFQVIKSTSESKLIADAYNNIGKSYYKKRQYKKALQAFTRGIDEDPGNEEIRMNRKVATQAYEAELGKD